jgi:hypothetical protein
LTPPEFGTSVRDMELTSTQKLAGIILGRPVEDWIDDRRTAGRSWRLIARDLYEATNGQVDITHEAVRRWADRKTAA